MTFRLLHLISLLMALSLSEGLALAVEKRTVKKYVYQKHTQIDLTGEVVQGNIRSPEVFYIFQRKRSEKIDTLKTPETFGYHNDAIIQILGRSL